MHPIEPTAPIHSIGAVCPDEAIPVATIREVLAGERRHLIHGAEFTGKPQTQIFSDEHHVVKLRGELRFNQQDARRWIERTLENEQAYQIHHPAKTWFLLESDDGAPLIANITPKLRPLHQLAGQLDPESFVEHLGELFEMYFRVASGWEKHLDEGLSNYALDDSGRLFYVDDDIYSWNEFASFGNAVGVYIRQLDWLTPELLAELGSATRRLIDHYFKDPHWAIVTAEQMRGLFMASDAQRQNLQAFIAGLYHKSPKPPADKATKREQPSPSGSETHIRQSRFAILADVHANLPALEAVLEKLGAP